MHLKFYCYFKRKHATTLPEKNYDGSMKSQMLCPCKSQNLYEGCCKLYHLGAPAPDAETLMRSRYSAYALGLADYIIKTTHPDHPQFNKKTWEWREDILSFSRATEFIDLEILAFENQDPLAYVTFTALLKQQGKDVSYTEKSLFEKKDDLWMYKDAEFL